MTKTPPLLAPERAAHASLEGYLYQSWLGVEAWLGLAEGEVLRCEGDEDLDRFLLDGSAESIQVKSLAGSVNLRDEVVKGTLRRFVVSHYLLRTRPEPETRRFVFVATAEQRRQRTDDVGVDILESWPAARDDVGLRQQVVAALRELLPWDEPAAKETGRHRFWSQHRTTLAWLDKDPERWAELIRSIEWRLGEPRRQEVEARVERMLAARGTGPTTELALRLLGRVLEASASPEIDDRLLDRAGLDDILSRADEDRARWVASPRGQRLAAVVSELDALASRITSGRIDREEIVALAALPPAKLLVAGLELIPFDEASREEILADLASWCAAEPRRRVRLIHGESGGGKTRLLLEWCRRLSGQGWICGFAQRGLTEDQLPDLLAGTVPRLLVIDYAATRPQIVEALLDRLVETPGGPKVRVVFLERRAGTWWQELGAPGHRLLLFAGGAEPVELTAAYEDVDSRRRAYKRARDAFAAARGRLPQAQEEPDLADPAFGRPLFLHLAALAAAEGDPARTAQEALHSVLARERRYWGKALEALGFDRERGRGLVEAMERALTVLTLLGGATSEEQAKRVAVGALPAGATASRIETLVRELHRFYAPAAETERWLDPLEPDLLGEALITGVLARHADLLPLAVNCGDEAGHRQLLTVLGRLAERGVADAKTWREGVLVDHLEPLALAALDLAIADAHLADWLENHLRQGASIAECRRVELLTADRIPFYSLPLQPLSLAAAQRALSGLPRPRLDPISLWWRRHFPKEKDIAFWGEKARILNNIGSRLSVLNRRTEALAATGEAVEILRRLASLRPDSFSPLLAMSLNNLGIDLASTGRRGEALEVTKEGVGIYRRLALSSPDMYLPKLGGGLNNLGNRLSELGRRGEAVAVAEESVGIYRRLAQASPDTFLSDLAASLNNLGLRLSSIGHQRDSLPAIGEAARIFRRLSLSRPDAFLPRLGESLSNLGTALALLGEHHEALAVAREAIGIQIRIASWRPDAFLPDLARGLNNLGLQLGVNARFEEARVAIDRSVEIRRRLASSSPDAFLPDLATSLNNLGNVLSELGLPEEALAAVDESLEVRRGLALSSPDAFLPDLATRLGLRAQLLRRLNRPAEAAGSAAEGLRVLLPFAERYPVALIRLGRATRDDYALACEQLDQSPDADLLARIDAAVGASGVEHQPPTGA